jgi:iron complex transport system ATP-binding protein
MLENIHNQTGIGIFLISHNLNLAANYAKRLIYLKDGRVLGSGTPNDMMNTDLLMSLFGIELETFTNPKTGQKNILYPGLSNI